MIKIEVNLNGGDLGLANNNTSIENIPLLIMKIGELFSSIRHLRKNDHEFSYCIQFKSAYKKTVEYMLLDLIREGLPAGTAFYEIDGNRIFEIRGESGGVSNSCALYLITKGE